MAEGAVSLLSCFLSNMVNMSHPLHKFEFCPLCGSAGFAINDASSKHCTSCGFVYYFNPRAAVVAVILDEKGRLLVARRANEPARGTLDLPGGFTECYETAEISLSREVYEETGITIGSCRYLFSQPNIYPYSGIDIHTMDLFFEVKVDSGTDFVSNDDVDMLRWMDLDSINPDDFGLKSISEGVKRIKNLYSDIALPHCEVER